MNQRGSLLKKQKRSRSLSKKHRSRRITFSPEEGCTDRDRRLRGLARSGSISPEALLRSRAKRLAKSLKVIKSGRLVSKRDRFDGFGPAGKRELPFKQFGNVYEVLQYLGFGHLNHLFIDRGVRWPA